MTLNLKICNVLFFLICFSLVFNNIPKPIQMNFIGAILSSKLVFYPFIIGLVYTLYSEYKYKNVFVNFKLFSKFLLIYLVITFLSLIIGLYIYPYYDLIINSPTLQIEKLPKVISILNNLGMYPDEKLLIIFWTIARTLKTTFLEIIYTFFGAYMIYCWYHNNGEEGFKILIKAVLSSLVVVFFYSVIELFYLGGNTTAKNILEIITPYFHTIKLDGNWWPPLLWKGQLRSIFAEPSYYGIYFSFAMPLLWYVALKSKGFINKILIYLAITFFSFGVFLTQARTAVALLMGEILILSFVAIYIYIRQKFILKKVINILCCTFLAFICANYFISNILVNNVYSVKNMDSYIKTNVTSLASTSKRSNNSRYSIMVSNLRIGLDNPILGVGKNLNNSYIPDYLPSMSYNNKEVNLWIKNQKERGIARSGFPILGEYTSMFAESGILGLMVFLIPPIILFYKLYGILSNKILNIDNNLSYIFFLISLIGIMATGIGSSINGTFCYWVLLGLGYAMCFGKVDNNKKHDK